MRDSLEAAKERRRERRAAALEGRRRTKAWRRDRSDPAYLDWIRGLPCATCGAPGTRDLRNEAHHEPPKGLGGGGDWHDHETIPLCVWCHTLGKLSRHALGSVAAFESAHGISVAAIKRRLQGVYDTVVRPKETTHGEEEAH